MGNSQKRHTPESRRQMVELYRPGRSFNELAVQFGCTSWSIRMWVKQTFHGRPAFEINDFAGILTQG